MCREEDKKEACATTTTDDDDEEEEDGSVVIRVLGDRKPPRARTEVDTIFLCGGGNGKERGEGGRADSSS